MAYVGLVPSEHSSGDRLILSGSLRVEYEGGSFSVESGQAVVAMSGEWVRYSTPGPEGAEYIAVCIPVFSPEAVYRDGEAGGCTGFWFGRSPVARARLLHHATQNEEQIGRPLRHAPHEIGVPCLAERNVDTNGVALVLETSL